MIGIQGKQWHVIMEDGEMLVLAKDAKLDPAGKAVIYNVHADTVSKEKDLQVILKWLDPEPVKGAPTLAEYLEANDMTPGG